MVGGSAEVDYAGSRGPTAAATQSFNGRMTGVLFITTVCASFGGLMFGYEIGIAGGTIGMDHFMMKFFNSIYDDRKNASGKYCTFDNARYQVVISGLFLTGAFVSLLSMPVQRTLGRKWTMFLGALFFVGGSFMLTFAENLATIVIGRIFWGISLGLTNSSVPVYLSEMAPQNLRGALNILFQLMTTIGIWCATLVNWSLTEGPLAVTNPATGADWDRENAWRYSWAGSFVPGGMMVLSCLLLPNTPQSLLELGKMEDARRVLSRVRGSDADSDAEFKAMVADHERTVRETPSMKAQLSMLTTKPYVPSLVIVIVMPFLQQFCGINSIEFYSNQVFEVVGINNKFRQTMILQTVNCVTTFVAIGLVDRVGRRGLLVEGACQMVVSLIAMAALVGTDKYNEYESLGSLTIFFMCFFVAGFAWSWGPVCWLIPTEIVPLEVRTAGMAIATWSNFLFTFIIGQCFTTMLCKMEYGVYIFFAFWSTCCILFTLIFLPETKGMKLEDVTAVLAQHPIWRSCFTEKKVPPTPIDLEANKSGLVQPLSSPTN